MRDASPTGAPDPSPDASRDPTRDPAGLEQAAMEQAALEQAAVALLARNDRASRMAAAQLLARGYAIADELRLAEQPVGLRQTELERLLAPEER